VEKGDYVLATKYSDGDPNDHWYLGIYDREAGGRHFVIDGEGNQARGNGFRRVKKISEYRGAWLLANAKQIEQSGKSIWWWVRQNMNLTTAST
jgi:hypothetical protein